MSKVIIGIHGLGNKPPAKLLKKWWIKALHEGLKKTGRNRLFVKFELVYWADLAHEEPLNPKEKNPDNELYLEEPYTPSFKAKEEKPSDLRKKILDFIEKQLDTVLNFINADGRFYTGRIDREIFSSNY